MDTIAAIQAFTALAQPTRLDALRILIGAAPAGMAAGDLAKALGVPHNTLSTHLAILARAGLIEAERRSRSIHYSARLGAIFELTAYLLKDCCGGRPEVCAPLLAEITPCCVPTETICADC